MRNQFQIAISGQRSQEDKQLPKIQGYHDRVAIHSTAIAAEFTYKIIWIWMDQ